MHVVSYACIRFVRPVKTVCSGVSSAPLEISGSTLEPPVVRVSLSSPNLAGERDTIINLSFFTRVPDLFLLNKFKAGFASTLLVVITGKPRRREMLPYEIFDGSIQRTYQAKRVLWTAVAKAVIDLSRREIDEAWSFKTVFTYDAWQGL